MKSNLLNIISPSTLFIDAKQKEWETGAPEMRITRGINSEFDFPSFNPSRKKLKQRTYFTGTFKKLSFDARNSS